MQGGVFNDTWLCFMMIRNLFYCFFKCFLMVFFQSSLDVFFCDPTELLFTHRVVIYGVRLVLCGVLCERALLTTRQSRVGSRE